MSITTAGLAAARTPHQESSDGGLLELEVT